MTDLSRFSQRLKANWLTAFCRAHGYSSEGFDNRGLMNLSADDACDFMQALDLGLVTHQEGFFTAPKSKAREQIFWQGNKNSVPRKITLWLEPIITIGALRRLHRDYSWPADCLGLQSKTWAFDLVGYDCSVSENEYLVCEVKKSIKEVDALIDFMQKHLSSPAEIEPSITGAERNAFKKVPALRTSRSQVFWALGPNHYEHVFKVERDKDGSVMLLPSDHSVLQAPRPLCE